jgi:hypothetical protein
VGQENRRSQRAQACQNGRRTEARRITPFALAERDRVSLGLIPGVLIPLSHAQDDLVSFVEGQTSFGTQRRPPIPLGRDHEGSDKSYLSDPMTSKTTIGEREKEEQSRNQLDNQAVVRVHHFERQRSTEAAV